MLGKFHAETLYRHCSFLSYVLALNDDFNLLKELLLSLRFIREIHAKLMKNVRAGDKYLREFRSSQNWIGRIRPGNALYVPLSPEYLMDYPDNFEKLLHNRKV